MYLLAPYQNSALELRLLEPINLDRWIIASMIKHFAR
jgi:hypothetical protein